MAFKADLKTAFTANFTATQRNRIMDAFAAAYQYQATIDGQPNPQNKSDFTVEKISGYIQDIVRSQERQAAVAAVPPPAVVTIT
ncbi:MAG: hypothetical protein ABI539_15160 [Acidobacteriota bacterium]